MQSESREIVAHATADQFGAGTQIRKSPYSLKDLLP